MFSISVGTVRSINDLAYHKVPVQWVPRLLTDEQKYLHSILLQHLMRYQQGGNVSLHQIVIGDES